MLDSEATATDDTDNETWNPEDWTCIDCGEPSGPNPPDQHRPPKEDVSA